MIEFKAFPKVPRLSRECIITEKIDGTNASVWVVNMDLVGEKQPLDIPPGTAKCYIDGHDYAVLAGSRNRFITVDQDNFGFARWVHDHAQELAAGLGSGVHYGEWWGSGIQRGYGLKNGEKHFSLFNVGLWWGKGSYSTNIVMLPPECCQVVPVLKRGIFSDQIMEDALEGLRNFGSKAAPGFLKPEGIMIYHTAARHMFKKTFEGDESGKEYSA